MIYDYNNILDIVVTSTIGACMVHYSIDDRDVCLLSMLPAQMQPERLTDSAASPTNSYNEYFFCLKKNVMKA